MAVENHDGTLVITGEHINYHHYLTVTSALALEINTGMKFSNKGSAMLVANKISGSTKRTKKGALLDLHKWLTANWTLYKPLPSVTKALGL